MVCCGVLILGFMFNSSTGRHKDARGDPTSPSAVSGNVMVSRVALIILLLLAERVWWILEQPVTSCMPSHPVLLAIQHLAMFPFVDWAVADTFLGAFGAPTIKHVRLYSNKWWVHGLSRSKPPFSDFAPSDTTTRETVINNQGVENIGSPGRQA